MRAKPDVALRAPASNTRSGCAQNDPSVQSGVSREIRTGSIETCPPSQSASRSGDGKIWRSRSATSWDERFGQLRDLEAFDAGMRLIVSH